MTRTSRWRPALALAAVLAAVLAGCSDSDHYDTGPAVYGEAGHCYYVDSPAEAIALQQAGLCPVNWAPMLMPSPWRARYAYVYDSPSYYNHYVPVSYRKTYVTHVHVYEKTTRGIVTKAPKVTRRPAASTANSVIRDSTSRQGFSTGTRPSRQPSAPRSSSRSFRTGSRR